MKHTGCLHFITLMKNVCQVVTSDQMSRFEIVDQMLRGYTNWKLSASLSCLSVPQGLFRPAGCISIGLFCSTGITLPRSDASLSGSFVPRDYFARPDASLADSFAPQGLLYPGQMHLYLALLCRRDYFARLNASLFGSFVPQGLFRLPGCIPSLEGHR